MSKEITKIYVCGPTVYNYVHIGNLRPILTYDFILKGYRANNKPFQFIHNITDIDDKIINKAAELNKSEKEISEFYTSYYLDLLKNLNVDTITHIEKVTDNLDVIDSYINKIIKNKSAYKDENGNVWFSIKNNEKYYGEVSNQNLDKMEFEENSDGKQFIGDFALWKNTTHGIKFNSSFGFGRPGWHTECCALIDKHFGKDGVDLHGGGMDLTFPHHENENIQQRAIYNEPLAKEWLRTGQINLNGDKMSKSLGNIILADDFINKYGKDILKLIILSAKITAPINITEELIQNMQNIKNKLVKFIFKFFTLKDWKESNKELLSESKEIMNALAEKDFAKYNLLLNEALKTFNKTPTFENGKIVFDVLKIIHPELTDKNQYLEELDIFNQWSLLIAKKDYQAADILRDKLIKKGVY
ncbi:Cysteine--tRNA ligase [Mycoplasmopsis columbina]|nr:class I tRNA ligase family protein [Mycoplasmopsis columbina]VEU76618.1 Cysteine--tRNA ligase [Mycoplasmopsis columbina]